MEIDRPVPGHFVDPLPELAEGDVHRTFQVSGGILPGFPHVDDIRAALHQAPDLGDMDLGHIPVKHVQPHQGRQVYDVLGRAVDRKENRMVGIVTVDDAIDVMEEEVTEDISKMAAITPSDKPYLKTSVFTLYKSRIPWLLLLMLSATFTGMIITHFEATLSFSIALTAAIPMLMDTGGNCGSQSSVTVIRALSLGELHFTDLVQVWWKEVRVALMCGVTLAAANFIKLILIERVPPLIALTICLTLLAAVMIAKFVGCTLPILADKLGFDPAVMASPFITTIVDALSLLIFCTFAGMLLTGAVA